MCRSVKILSNLGRFTLFWFEIVKERTHEKINCCIAFSGSNFLPCAIYAYGQDYWSRS